YMIRLRLADLFLDTAPYNAGTTASDALWMGLPVLTLLGTTFAGRMAASLLTAIDMCELIAPTAEQYEAMAIALAKDPAHLSAIARKLAAHRSTTRLFDTRRFARTIEAAYAAMVERHAAGLSPDHIDVSAG
ncbi:MAG: glycosyltransferase, partial [Rhodospirillales bacterium]